MKKDCILFDLDGTVTNPKVGITSAVAYALERCGYPVPENPDDLCYFIGPPLHETFKRHCSCDDAESEKLVETYREYYRPKGLFECDIYIGIPEFLADLKKAGKRVFLATSKPEEMAVEVLKHFDLFKYFDGVYGATYDRSRTAKDKVIAYLLEEEKIEDPSTAVMIGDRLFDVKGARANGIETIGVSYGYSASPEEFADAVAVAGNVDELREMLL